MELVKHHNNFNKIRLGTLTEKELDIFITLIFTMQEKDTRTVNMSFSELKGIVETQRETDKRLVDRIRNLNKKLVALNQEIKTERGYLTFNLFEKLEIFTDTREVNIKITETFSYMLTGLTEKFTLYSLKEYIGLNSGYSKQVFKILKQYQNLGCFHQLKLDDFKELLSVPNTYTTTNFNKKILAPILQELASIFNNLKIIKLDKNNKPVGRGKKTISIRFEWDREVRQPRATLQDNVRAKEDKQRLLADEKAKARIEKTEKLISEKKELSELERAKGKLIAQYSKNGKYEMILEISKIETLEQLTEFKLHN